MTYNIEVARAYRKRNHERIKAYSRKYMQEYRQQPKIQEYFRKYYLENGDDIRQRACDGSRQKLYGISPEQFEEMKQKQNNLCFVCGNPPPEGWGLGIDHNHKTKEVRVLLCQGCNWLVGRIEALGWNKIQPYVEKYLMEDNEKEIN